MIIKDADGFTAEVHLYDKDTGLDFVEEYLNAEWEYKEMRP